MKIIKEILIIIFLLFLLLVILFHALLIYSQHLDIAVYEDKTFTSSVSREIIPNNWGLENYFKEGKDFKYIYDYQTPDNIKFTAKLEIKNLVKIEEEFDRRNIDNFEISCKNKKYKRLCKTVSASKNSKIKVYKIKKYIEPDDLNGQPIYWFLYKDGERIGFASETWWGTHIYECSDLLCYLIKFVIIDHN